ncbi:hypothetical protein CAPTEDRAFT_221212 [Capitella teleta]|uniref:Uncharacterized protein n=1 Tax=Capitella teleta TaxID=283909 RepID=R7VAZ0_CAPTE|nr:hypothetical protein CAPTEDRAFT_221212 [Capitella teleta]|eukprot:ELU16013.1 hypothetical protein CAPTEDRAFT_221212 [Capitella teleta]
MKRNKCLKQTQSQKRIKKEDLSHQPCHSELSQSSDELSDAEETPRSPSCFASPHNNKGDVASHDCENGQTPLLTKSTCEHCKPEAESVGSAIACPFSVKQETDAAPHTAATDQAPTMAVYDKALVALNTKVDLIYEQLGEAMTLLKHLVSVVSPVYAAEAVEVIFPKPAATVPDLLELDERLQMNVEFRRQLTAYLAALGGSTILDTVRRMMKKLATAQVWSQFSLLGRKSKKSLVDEASKVVDSLIKAYQISHPGTTEDTIQNALQDCLKATPRWPGGPRSSKASCGGDAVSLEAPSGGDAVALEAPSGGDAVAFEAFTSSLYSEDS